MSIVESIDCVAKRRYLKRVRGIPFEKIDSQVLVRALDPEGTVFFRINKEGRALRLDIFGISTRYTAYGVTTCSYIKVRHMNVITDSMDVVSENYIADASVIPKEFEITGSVTVQIIDFKRFHEFMQQAGDTINVYVVLDESQRGVIIDDGYRRKMFKGALSSPHLDRCMIMEIGG